MGHAHRVTVRDACPEAGPATIQRQPTKALIVQPMRLDPVRKWTAMLRWENALVGQFINDPDKSQCFLLFTMQIQFSFQSPWKLEAQLVSLIIQALIQKIRMDGMVLKPTSLVWYVELKYIFYSVESNWHFYDTTQLKNEVEKKGEYTLDILDFSSLESRDDGASTKIAATIEVSQTSSGS